MIASGIHNHVHVGRHVTFHTLGARGLRFMKVVRGRVECGGSMATRAQSIALIRELEAMGFVAVAAGDSGRIHLALQERPIHIHLILNLAITMVQPFHE